MNIHFSSKAKADLLGIVRYTVEIWGKQQAEKYKSLLDEGFQTLQDNPEIGYGRDEHFPGCRCFRVERHVVFYSLSEKGINIVRVLNHRQDFARHLSGQPLN